MRVNAEDDPPPDPIQQEKDALKEAVKRAQIAVEETEAALADAGEAYDAALDAVVALLDELGCPTADKDSDAYKAWYAGLSAENKKKVDDAYEAAYAAAKAKAALTDALAILKQRLEDKKKAETDHCTANDGGD